MSVHENLAMTSEWLTPPWIFSQLGVVFDLDPCASDSVWSAVPLREGANRWTKNNPAPGDYEWPTYALVWLNPPYGSKSYEFLHQMANHAKAGGSGVALLPARTDTNWFHSYVFAGLAERASIVFLHGRVWFVRADTGQVGQAPAFPSVVVGWGPTGIKAVTDAGFRGALLELPTQASRAGKWI